MTQNKYINIVMSDTNILDNFYGKHSYPRVYGTGVRPDLPAPPLPSDGVRLARPHDRDL